MAKKLTKDELVDLIYTMTSIASDCHLYFDDVFEESEEYRELWDRFNKTN